MMNDYFICFILCFLSWVSGYCIGKAESNLQQPNEKGE